MKKIAIFLSITLLIFALASCSNNSSDTEKLPEKLPDGTALLPDISEETKESTVSKWANGAWLKDFAKENVKTITITDTKPEESDDSWKFDGFNIYEKEGDITIVTSETIHIEGSAEMMFADLSSLVTITGIEKFDFSKCTSVSNMFKYCKSLVNLDLSKNSFEKAKDMSYFLSECYCISTFKIADTELKDLQTTEGMFYYCSNLGTITFPSSPNVKTTEKMFSYVGGSVSDGTIISGSMDFPNCTNYNEMFRSAHFYVFDFVKTFNTEKMETAVMMFAGCNGGGDYELDLSGWNTSNLQNAEKMFFFFSHSITVNLDGWDCSSLTNCKSMFECTDFSHNIILNWKNTSNIENVERMFCSCASLKKLDISCLNGISVGSIDQMFYLCDWLTEIKCEGFNFTSGEDVFTGCTSLKGAVEYDETRVGSDMANTNGYFVK